jgi:hypothetical protein
MVGAAEPAFPTTNDAVAGDTDQLCVTPPKGVEALVKGTWYVPPAGRHVESFTEKDTFAFGVSLTVNASEAVAVPQIFVAETVIV